MYTQIVIPFVYQLTEKELQQFDIEHYGAVFNINLLEKENAIMIEKLNAYRVELENLKASELTKDYTAEIEQRVADYRATLQAEYAAQTEALVAKIDSDLNCLTWLIQREMETAQVATEVCVAEHADNQTIGLTRGPILRV